ncbi:YL1-domain-containing protein [Saccharata proteae CBS 121410]|uniref:YL1-domain-containing protein n=1 Tax=Saccharata proteae CBS 121410 TaxID=1314787 RepID=A0A9P4HNZ6_9PEZI|nr:YL1-domain-containing protein [Saccharata proteae CBS 121410]
MAAAPKPANDAFQRSRRANAGNRMRSLLEAAGSDQQAQGDEWYHHEAFAEDAEDEEFGGIDPDDHLAANDEVVSSSSEDEDAQDQDEDAAERALQKEERKQKLKRKHPDLLEQAALKKAKVATAKAAASDAGSMAPPPKPKKKSERVSWLPVEADGPVRASSRNLTLQNKQNVTNSLQQKEANRIRILKMMEASNVRKERDKPQGPITQEERLAEAAKVERQNAKTVSRWEESERQREEEQRARLEALKNRKLDGPFIRYYSGPSIWVPLLTRSCATRGTKSSAQNQELCTITSLPARYRDPATGLVYHDAYAYKCLRRFVDQGTAGWNGPEQAGLLIPGSSSYIADGSKY